MFIDGGINYEPARGNHDGVSSAFSGDISKIGVATRFKIDGAALGQPTTGYQYTPESSPHYTYMQNTSGWNNSTSSNDGRTSATAYRAKVSQYGQGDAVCFNGSVFVLGTRAGSTSFLANPAGSLFNGDMGAGSDGVYLNPYETYLSDNGYDVACIGAVYNMSRSNATGAKSVVWAGARYQSVGTAACDNIISGTGKFNAGIDFSMSGLDFGANKAAISLKAGQRIYFNSTASASGNLGADWRTTGFNQDFIDYDSATQRLRVIVGNSAVATFHASQGADFQNGLNIASGKTIRVNGIQVIQGRNSGFTPMTGTYNSSTAYSTSSISLQQLAERVNALQTALTIHGLIGA